MEAHEVLEKFKKNEKAEDSFEEVVEWCSKNASKLDLSNKDQVFLFEISTRYLVKMKLGNWDETDTKLIINYFAKTYARKQGIEKDTVIKILQKAEYKEKFGDDSNGICISKDNGKSEIVYSSSILENLTGNDTVRFVRALQTVFHEVVHAKQCSDIYSTDRKDFQYDGNVYKITLEAIMRKAYPKFYRENYHNLIREYQANYFGLEQAMKMIEIYYKPGLFKEQDIEKFLNDMMVINGKSTYENIGEVSFEQRNIKASALINFAADQYVQALPEIINKMPVLKFAYNTDGNRKSIIQLIQDRATLIRNNSEVDLQKIDDLYKTIANYKEITGDEMIQLYDYIIDEVIEDEFTYGLLQYRIEKTGWSKEKISEFMERTRKKVAELRKKREN